MHERIGRHREWKVTSAMLLSAVAMFGAAACSGDNDDSSGVPTLLTVQPEESTTATPESRSSRSPGPSTTTSASGTATTRPSASTTGAATIPSTGVTTTTGSTSTTDAPGGTPSQPTAAATTTTTTTTTSTTTTTTTTTVAPSPTAPPTVPDADDPALALYLQAAVDRYNAAWAAASAAPGNPNHPDLIAATTDGSLRADAQELIQERLDASEALRPGADGVVFDAVITNVEDVNELEAVASACYYDAALWYEADTGAVINDELISGTLRVTFRAVNGSWLVDDWVYIGDEVPATSNPCR